MYELGVIGLGNMGGAIIRGALAAGFIEASKLIIFEKNRNKILDLLDENFALAQSEEEVARYSKRIILAIKPQDFGSLANKIRDCLDQDSIIISIAAGHDLDDLGNLFGHGKKYIWAMTNLSVQVGEGMTGLVIGQGVDEEEVLYSLRFFESLGKVALIDQNKMASFSAAIGSMPAILSLFLEGLADGAVKTGLSRREAYDFIVQAIIGSAKYLQETKEHPGLVKDKVASPQGVTIDILTSLEEDRFRYSLIKALDQGVQASKDLRKES